MILRPPVYSRFYLFKFRNYFVKIMPVFYKYLSTRQESGSLPWLK